MKTQEAIQQVEDFLLTTFSEQYPESEKPKITLIVWPNQAIGIDEMKRHSSVGIRIAEVGFSYRSSGEVYMQVDQEGASACFYAERLVIAIAEKWPEEEILEEKWRLVYAVFGKTAAQKFADSNFPVEVV